jgi:hypothetical protein
VFLATELVRGDARHTVARSYLWLRVFIFGPLYRLGFAGALAEAPSGKSVEFQERCAGIRNDGGFALYLTIERLEKNGPVGTLGRIDREAFGYH